MVSRSLAGLLFAFLLCSTASATESDASAPLTREELLELVYDQTVDCRKEKDQSTCVNYFSDEGVLVQVLHKNNKRKDGRWFLDDSDRLCILWDGKFKPLCFVVTKNDDGSYNMIKRGKHMSTMLKFYEGNSEKL